MINILTHEINTGTVRRLVRTAGKHLPPIRFVTYQSMFRSLRIPPGTLVFTDFDLLNPVEIECASTIARTIRTVRPQTRILNDPARVCERVEALHRLRAIGLTDVEITRLDTGETPSRYPVFIRREDAAEGPETGLLDDEPAFLAAIEELRAAGKSVKHRVAVTYVGERYPDGYFRKYGCFRIGDKIIAQHILRNQSWCVKADQSKVDLDFAAEELAFVDQVPHADEMMRACKETHVEFGRVDYGIVGGKLSIYEINTNPSFPNYFRTGDNRSERRHIILPRLNEAFATIASPDTGRAHVPFTPPDVDLRFLQMRRWDRITRLVWDGRVRMARKKTRS